MCSFHIFLSIFGCHGNAVCFIESSHSICLFLIRTYCSREKLLSILYRSEICAILACFCLFGCHSNSLCPWKIQTACLNSTTPKPYHIHVRRNWHYITYRTEICAFLAFLCKFGCYGNSLRSPKIFISIFEFSDPENLTIHANIVSIAFNWTEICGILVYSCIILVTMATPLALSKIQVAYLNSTTPYLHA